MSKAVHRRHRASQDLIDIYRYLAREAGLRVARHFFVQTEATFTRLAGMPGIGASYEHEHPALTGLRVFPVSRFKKYIVFYRPVADGIEILRVLHGARDFHGLLGEGFDLPEDDEATGDPDAP